MGKRGVKPAPTALKLLNGTKPSRINRAEPASKALEHTPRPPEWVNAEGKRYWRRLAPDLRKSGRLTTDSVDSFALWCDSMGRYERAARIVNDPEIDWFPGNRRHPALLEVRESGAMALRYSQEFGLTPSARGSIKVPPPADPEEARRLLS